MRLRKLIQKDATRMLEWMHDPFVVDKLQTNFLEKTIEDCLYFINNSYDSESIHLAVVDDNDIYMGTVSLKHIKDKSAEFAITVHRDAMGKGLAICAMREIIRKGFDQYGLKSIYWCVAKDNLRALRFYDKNGFERISPEKIQSIYGYTDEQIRSYSWYQVSLCL